MPRNNKYAPDYNALYPGTVLTAKVLCVLKQSDRKIKYMEYDLKAELSVKDENGAVIGFTPSREDSLERLLEQDKQFAARVPSPEQVFFGREERLLESRELYRCLALLDEGERKLVAALFFDGLTEEQYAKSTGSSQSTIHRRKVRVIHKLKNYFDFSD